MAFRDPPGNYSGSPSTVVLKAGTVLSRVHSDNYRVVEFNPTISDSPYRGGRFDATSADRYSYLYAASDDPTAVSETLLRDLPIDHHGSQLLPRSSVRGKRLSWVTPVEDLTLVSFQTGEDLAAVAQTTWLVQCGPNEYSDTRRWAHAIRGWATTANGFVWRSNREPDGSAYIFFGDRCQDDVFEPVTDNVALPPDDNFLDRGAGEIYLREILVRYRATLYP